MFLMDGSNQHRLLLLIVVSLGPFVIIIFIKIWFINYPQDQIIILKGAIDEVGEILGEIPGDEDVIIVVLLPYGRLSDGYKYPTPYLFTLIISRSDGIWVTYFAVA